MNDQESSPSDPDPTVPIEESRQPGEAPGRPGEEPDPSGQDASRIDQELEPTAGMSTQARVIAIIGVILVIVLGIWWATRGNDADEVVATPSATTTPTSTATATASPSQTPTPTPSASDTPTPTASASGVPSTSPTAAPTDAPTDSPTSVPVVPSSGDLVVAGDDGVWLRTAAGMVAVPGTSGPVMVAFADRDGGIVLQADDQSIDLVVDGTAATIVDIADFAPIDPDGTSLNPHSITLMDVDSIEDQMVFTVEYRDGGTSTNADRTQSIVSATDGVGQRVIQTDALFEAVIEHSLGGNRRATLTAGEGQGNVRVYEGDSEVTLGWDTAWDVTDPDDATVLKGPQLDDSGARLAVTRRADDGSWSVVVVDTVAGTEQFELPVDETVIPLDLLGNTLVVFDTATDTSSEVDMTSGSTQSVPGRATIAR